MKARAAAVGMGALSLAYLAAFVWLEQRRDVAGLRQLAEAAPLLVSLTALSWAARFARWQWLLRRLGHRPAVGAALPAYLTGFAFTATPGKVGELVRIRYFRGLGVPAGHVLSAFVFERACDLLVVLALAAISLHGSVLFAPAAAFVLVLVAILLIIARQPVLLSSTIPWLRKAGCRRCARLARLLRDGLAGSRAWLNAPDLVVSCACGLLAWSATSLTLLYLLSHAGVAVPALAAFGIYPLSMLVGAASMLPGGLGSTEAAIVALLGVHNVPWQTGALLAMAVRLATLWFAVAVGFVALAWLEVRALGDGRDQARSTE